MGPRFELVACSAPASARSVVRQEPAVHRGETGSPSDRRRGLTLGARAVGPSRGMQSRSDMATARGLRYSFAPTTATASGRNAPASAAVLPTVATDDGEVSAPTTHRRLLRAAQANV